MHDALIAALAALGPTLAGFAAWRNTRKVGNGWTEHVLEELGQIKGLLTAHVQDNRAHNRDSGDIGLH
jgi:hypothetical protein